MKKYICIIILCCCTLVLKAQVFITGRVINSETGNPLAGANIFNGSSALSTVSDTSGNFKIRAGTGSVLLTITYTGYETRKMVLKPPFSTAVSVEMRPAIKALDEVVVSTGYQTVPQDRTTGSFAQVDNALFNRRVSSDVLSRLEGVVPGLLFNRNTVAGSNGGVDISIRGTSTLFAGTQPLVVVDGFPYDGDINNIDPNTVASISILKDAAAASIWGVKSGNGVIVIVTKQGSRGKKLTIDFNTNITIGAKPDLFYYDPDFLDANDFINVEESLFKMGYYDGNLGTPYILESPVVELLAGERAGTLSAASANAQINALRNVDVRDDLTKYFYRHPADQQYDLDLNGGGQNIDYFVAGSFDNDQTAEDGNGDSRVTLNTSYNFYPSKHLTVSTGLNYSQTIGTSNSPLANINGGGGYGLYPYAQLVAANGTALPIAKDYATAYTDTAGNGKFYDWKYRPLDELHNAGNTFKTLDNRINLGLKYTFPDGFTAEAHYEYEDQKGSTSDNYSDQTYYTRNLLNEFTAVDPYGNITYNIPQGGILQNSASELTAQRGRLQLDYQKVWNANNDLSAIAGAEINQTITDQSAETIYGYNSNTLAYQSEDFVDYFPRNPDGSYAQIPNSESLNEFTNRYISYYSNAGYTYDGRYSLSLSGRIDKSNLFGVNTNQKSVPLYSTGLAWDISKESFYHLSWLPFAKLRATYGYNGNVDNNVTALTTFQQVSGATYSGLPYGIISSPGDPELRWEQVRIINLGLDFAAKNQVLSGTFEYYVKRGLDIFGDTPLAPSTGFLTFRGNTADIAGNGLDLTVNANMLQKGGFRWQSTFLLSHVLDKVTKYDSQLDVASYLLLGSGNAGTIYPLTDRPLYAIYSYKWGGLTHETGDPQGYLNGQKSTDYAAIIASTTTADMVYNGPSRPTTYGAFRNTFSYQRLSFSMNIIYKLDYYFRRTSINYNELYTSWIGNKDFDKRWQKPGDELTTNVPSLVYPPVDPNRDQFYSLSSILVDNGDNIRLQDLDISYDLIVAADKKKSAFTRLSVYFYINNIAILWRANHDGLDPDLYTGELPVPKTIAFGIKATF